MVFNTQQVAHLVDLLLYLVCHILQAWFAVFLLAAVPHEVNEKEWQATVGPPEEVELSVDLVSQASKYEVLLLLLVFCDQVFLQTDVAFELTEGVGQVKISERVNENETDHQANE